MSVTMTGDILDQYRAPSASLDAVRERASLNKDEFLLLLTEQLKAQNPLNPSDNKEFAAQLAQFTQLEQTIEMREALQEQVRINTMLTQSITNLNSANLIGRSVKANTNQINYDGENMARFGFELPSAASNVKVEITDAAGNIVRTFETRGTAGENNLQWDGKRDDGTYANPGNYRFSVVAETGDGGTLRSSPFAFGVVDSIRFTGGGASVIVGGVAIPVSSITDVSGVAARQASNSSSDGNATTNPPLEPTPEGETGYGDL